MHAALHAENVRSSQQPHGVAQTPPDNAVYLPLSHTQCSHFASMAIQTAPLPLPASADPSKFTEFGREVLNVSPGNLSPEDFAEIEKLLYKVYPTFIRPYKT